MANAQGGAPRRRRTPLQALLYWSVVLGVWGLIFVAGFLVLGIQSGINVIGAMVYPTSLRANGSGWELGIGRIGSIVGPLLGALLIGLPVDQLYMWSALPFAAGAVICFLIHRLNTARLRAHPELRDAQ